KRSLALLEELGLLVRKNGKLAQSNSQLSTGDEVAMLGVVRYHQNMIDLGRRSLTAIDENRRDISSISFACNEAFIAELKKEVSAFRKKILT
ncbi:TIGR02147 family protein, partial [Acinetobacter baumannii]